MNCEEIIKLLEILIGETRAWGSHGKDMDVIVPNVEKLGQITVELISELDWIANSYENRGESSIKAVGMKARYWVDFIENEVLDTKKSS